MKINPMKCSFGIFGKLLKYLMIRRGIIENPDQIRAIKDIPSPTKNKEINALQVGSQHLEGSFLDIKLYVPSFEH